MRGAEQLAAPRGASRRPKNGPLSGQRMLRQGLLLSLSASSGVIAAEGLGIIMFATDRGIGG